MRQVTSQDCDRIERAELMRALDIHEKAAADLRSRLGLVTREKFETVAPSAIRQDGVTRLRTDQVDRLYQRGILDMPQRSAALKFRQVFEAMSRGLYSGSRSDGGGTSSRGRFRHPLERMSPHDLFVWFHEYKPWASGPAAKFPVDHQGQVKFRRSYLQICYAVIIDNFGPSQLEDLWPVPRGKGVISRVLSEGLAAWTHKEYDPSSDLETLRTEIVTQAMNRIDRVKPRRVEYAV